MKKIIAAISALLITSTLAVANASALSLDDIYAWVRSEEISADETDKTEETSETSDTSMTDVTSVTTTDTTTETTTETSATTTITTTVESETPTTTPDTEKEKLKKQIEELEKQLEERGMTIDNLSCTIDELQYALMEANNRILNDDSASGGGGGASGGSASKAPVVTTVTEETTIETTTVTVDTLGNAELVEAVEKIDTERQFITVSAKDGSVFYIVIDHEGNNDNVYFLNKVDVADLNAIIDPDGENKVTEVVTEPVVTEPVIVTEEPVKKEKSNIPTILLLVVGMAAFAGIYYFFKIRPKKNSVSDDYDEEEDGEDFDKEEEYIEE